MTKSELEPTVPVTDAGVGVVEAIRVGHNLQEDVHLAQDGSESRVFPVICHNLGRCDSQRSRFMAREQLDGRKTSQSSVSQLSNHLFGKPGAASLSDPLPGVDSSVDPDGGAVGSTSAELGRGWKRGNKYSEQ